jgi:TolB-like protein
MSRKIISSVVIFAFMYTLFFSSMTVLYAQNREKIPRIAVFELVDTNVAAEQEKYGEAIAGMLMTDLINGKVFQVIERSEVDRMMNEMAFQVSGAVDANTAKRIGEILGVDILVFGTVAKFGQVVETDIRLVDTQTGRAILAEHAKSESGIDIRTMVENLARKIEKRYLGRLVEEVVISSTPQGAMVYIDGVNEGNTPLVKNLNQGPHKIRILKENYTPWEESVVVVQGGNKVNAQLTLSPEYQKEQIEKKQAAVQPTPVKETKKGGSKTALYVLGGALLIGGGVAAAMLLSGDKGEEEAGKTTSTVNIIVDLP